MNSNRELVSLPGNFNFDFAKYEVEYGYDTDGVVFNDKPDFFHFHDCIELVLIEQGKGTIFIENSKFCIESGDIYIFNNLERHGATFTGTVKTLVIYFNPVFVWQGGDFDYEYIKPFYNRSINFSNCIRKDHHLSFELVRVIKRIEDEWNTRDDGYKLMVKALLMELLATFSRHFKLNTEVTEEKRSFFKSYDRIRSVIEYLNENFKKNPNLAELSKIAMMNKTYFSTYFKEIMQTTVHEYIMNLKINSACSLLKTTNRNIIDICADCGFESLSSFNKSFKKVIGKTPSVFRNS